MHTAVYRAATLGSFFVSCIFVVFVVIGALNFFIRSETMPPVTIVVDNAMNRLGVEDYFMNRKVILTDFLLNLEAGKSRLFGVVMM